MLADTPALLDKWTFTLLLPPDTGSKAPAYKKIRVEEIGRNGGALWEQVDLPWHTRGKLLLSLCNAAPILKRKQAVVIHDAAPARVPESYSRGFRLWYRLLMPWLGRMAQQILTVSEFSRRELSLAYAIPAVKISVLPESGEHILRMQADDAVLDRMSLRHRPYVLGVSSMSPHKNFTTLIRAVELLEGDCGFDVVIAGGANPRIFAAAKLPAFVKYAGYVTDEELRALYEHAACFVFPSYYEGFGLPAAEAMALGCPVIAANAASIPEVCGDAAIYFDSRRPDELANILRTLIPDSSRLQLLGLRSKAQSATQQWRHAATGLLQTLQERGYEKQAL
jgi:glycosyltransferase involved in cell wall biosynthesis